MRTNRRTQRPWRHLVTGSVVALVVAGALFVTTEGPLAALRPKAAVWKDARSRLAAHKVLVPPRPRSLFPLQIETRYPASLAPQLEIDTSYPTLPPTRLSVDVGYRPLPTTRLRIDTSFSAVPSLVALTFDTEIPHGTEARETLNRVLDILHDAGVRATFFVVGRWVRANPDALRRILADGHEVANHSFSHHAFTNRSLATVPAEIDQVAELVRRDTGTTITPLFRPPYGCIDRRAARLIRRDGYQLVGWTASGRDALSGTTRPTQVLAALRGELHPGAVVLLHTNHWVTAEALPLILRRLARLHLQAVPLLELLRSRAISRRELAESALHDCDARIAHAGRQTASTAD